MARRVPCIVSAILLLVPFPSLLCAFQLPDRDTFSKWNLMLETKLSELVAAVTQIDAARNRYHQSDPRIQLHKVDGEKILSDVLVDITKLLERKKTALRKLVKTAEDNVIYFDTTYEVPMLTLEDVPFFNVKHPPVESSELAFSSRYRQRVSFERSGVHIPVDIFDGWMGPRYKESWWHDPEILNGLNWSASLDSVFKENWDLDPTLRWQYFGSYYGFMRVYPAFKWPDHPSLPDLFDVRRRSWYVQGSVTPKDVIILIDRSGSVHGQTLDIMKITVRALLNSLSENDYVNVAWFNNRVNWVVPCLATLVQATAQNRRLLSDAVERLVESNFTSYATALDFAFEAFRKFDETKEPWAGSNCHKLIMFLSDGGTEWPTERIKRHCNESREGQIKIFTFACGPHPIPTVVLKEMACATGGFFSPITALGSVRVKIQDYVRVLSRPLAAAEDQDMFQWHNFYRDIGGLGMMTTVTLPVYNKNIMQSFLLGVMGIDIPVDEMMDLYPQHKLGPFGYSFSINTNGFVVFHPRLRDHIVYIEDPPDVDLKDVEGTSEAVDKMRDDMVRGKAGSLKRFTSLVPVGLGHAIPVTMDYFYNKVEPSTFRFGLAVPSDQQHATVSLPDVAPAAGLLLLLEGALLAPWRYCPFDEANEELTNQELADRIIHNFSSCDRQLVERLLWDATKCEKIRESWQQSTLSGVWARFVMTSSGLTLVHPAHIVDEYLRQKDPLKNNLFRRASHRKGCVLSVARGRTQEVTVACSVSHGSHVAAVIGVEMEQSLVGAILDEVTASSSHPISCSHSDSLFCYLLNDGGVVISSNQPFVKAGDFLGIHDPQLLEGLLSVGMLQRESRYNYQSWCSRDTPSSPTIAFAASSHSIPFISVVYETILSLDWSFLYTTVIYLISSLSLWRKVESAEAVDPGNHSCMTRSTWYYSSHHTSITHTGAFTCNTTDDECHRNFTTSFLPNVTLILVVAEPPCPCATPQPVQTLDPQEDVGPNHCSIQQPYRLRPEKCYYQTVRKDNTSECGASYSSIKIPPRFYALIILSYILGYERTTSLIILTQ